MAAFVTIAQLGGTWTMLSQVTNQTNNDVFINIYQILRIEDFSQPNQPHSAIIMSNEDRIDVNRTARELRNLLEEILKEA